MAEFVFWYSQEVVRKGYLTADSIEEARELLGSASWGPMDLEDLPNFSFKDKDFRTEVDFDTLKEIAS